MKGFLAKGFIPIFIFMLLVVSTPEKAAAQCTVTCLTAFCDWVKHRAISGSFDEVDGGRHNTCFDQSCWWFDEENGKHPQCAGGSEEDFEEVDLALSQMDLDRASQILQNSKVLYLNFERQSIQMTSPCNLDDKRVIANLPVREELFQSLVALLDR